MPNNNQSQRIFKSLYEVKDTYIPNKNMNDLEKNTSDICGQTLFNVVDKPQKKKKTKKSS